VPNQSKRPSGSAPRRLRLAIAAALPCLALIGVALPAGAQESTVAPASAPAKPAHHHVVGKAKPPAGSDSAADKGAAGSSAADNGSPFALTSGKGPINIQSDQLSLDYKGKRVLFSGHVHAIQSGSQMICDTLHVNYEQNFKDIKDMTAEHNVRISQGGRWSTSDHAVLDEKLNTVVLTGNPVVHDGQDQITGDRITVYLSTGKSVVEHARAEIFPRSSQTADNGTSGTPEADQQPTALDPATAGSAADNGPAPAQPDGH